VEIELSPYIHSLFKIATSWSNGLCIKDIVKLRMSDVSQSPQVFAMELHCQFWYRDFGGRLPRIVFAAIPFLLDEILESPLVSMTVKYLFYFLFCFSINDYGGGWSSVFHPVIRLSGAGVSFTHWIELLHPVWQL